MSLKPPGNMDVMREHLTKVQMHLHKIWPTILEEYGDEIDLVVAYAQGEVYRKTYIKGSPEVPNVFDIIRGEVSREALARNEARLTAEKIVRKLIK